MKKIIIMLLAFVMLLAFASCTKDETPQTETSSIDETTTVGDQTTTDEQTSTEDQTSTNDDTSTSTGETDKPKVEVERIDYDISIAQTINTSVFTQIDSFKNNGTEKTYQATALDITGAGEITIETAGVYKISGTTSKGQIVVDIKKTTPLAEVVLILDNVSITSSTDPVSTPPIYSEGCNLTIVLPDGSVNTINDTKTNAQKGAIYVKTGTLTINGKGTLNVNGNFKSGITNTKSMTINGGIFNINAEYHGIYGEEGLTINSGEFNINAKKSGLKVGDYEAATAVDPEKNTIGNLAVNGGKLIINSDGDGINVNGDVQLASCGANISSKTNGMDVTGNITVTSSDVAAIVVIQSIKRGIKCDSTVTVSGTANLKVEVIVSDEEAYSTTDMYDYKKDCIAATDVVIDTTGTVYLKTNASFKEDKTGSYILDSKQYVKVDTSLFTGKIIFSIDGSNKGIEASNSIVIKNGTVAVDACEDALKANTVVISAGTVNLATYEDAIQADTSITVSGNTSLHIIDANKGLKAPTVTVNSGSLSIVTVSDSIDSAAVTVNGGELYLFEKVDIGETGTFTVNGGKIVCISTTNNPKAPTSTQMPMLAASVTDCAGYVFGGYIELNVSGMGTTVLKIPKSYAKKLSVLVISSDITSGTSSISVGSYVGGTPKNLVCTGGTFTVTKTMTVNH
ncbi:MAG: carbohydrate-binding domain-containing protein [Clostridia bacterium]|nr:carbohydrate-binding domain-containing protein [Clostridia bacterium]